MQAVLVRISARLLKKTLLRTDERAKLEGELLDGMDVVKCMTWEVGLLTYMLSEQPVRNLQKPPLPSMFTSFWSFDSLAGT